MRREAVYHLGVRRDGRVVGHVRADDLAGEGDLSRFETFSPAEILEDAAGLNDVLDALADRDVAFVRVLGAVTGVVQRRDLEKPPMRMWLFGMVSLIEMNVTWAVQELFPGDAWTENLSPARVEKARGLQSERERRGQDADLLSCLQLSDKLGLLVKDERHRELLQIQVAPGSAQDHQAIGVPAQQPGPRSAGRGRQLAGDADAERGRRRHRQRQRSSCSGRGHLAKLRLKPPRFKAVFSLVETPMVAGELIPLARGRRRDDLTGIEMPGYHGRPPDWKTQKLGVEILTQLGRRGSL